MTDDKWQDLIGRLADDGKIESRETEELDGRPGTVERVIVRSPLGRLRLSRTTQPRKVGEKTMYAKRASATAAVEAQYDEEDIVHVFTVEREAPPDGWQEITAADLAL